MRIAICDDIQKDLYDTKKLILDYCKQAMLQAEIDLYADGGALLQQTDIERAYDLYLLDIYMEPVSGIDVARRIRQADAGAEIIFITTSPDFALEGYKVHAIGYLLKPLTQEALTSLLNHHSYRFAPSARYITIRHDRNDLKIPHKSIIYVEVFGKQAIFHTFDGPYHTWTSLDEVERLLGGEPFLRCHRSYLVNMEYIECIAGSDFILENGTKIPFPSHDITQYKKIWQDFVFSKAKGQLYEKL